MFATGRQHRRAQHDRNDFFRRIDLMRAYHLTVLSLLTSILAIGGIVMNEAMAQYLVCRQPLLGCPNVPCTTMSGTCPNGVNYTSVAQQGFTYTPCDPGIGTPCPSNSSNKYICFSAAYTATAAGPCGTEVCSTWYYDYACP